MKSALMIWALGLLMVSAKGKQLPLLKVSENQRYLVTSDLIFAVDSIASGF